jgi:hypothetical protein
VSGLGEVPFEDPHQGTTRAAFSAPGTYVLELGISNGELLGAARATIAVNAQPPAEPGWIGSPADGSAVSRVVPITLAPRVTLASGTLSYVPASDTTDVRVLNASPVDAGAKSGRAHGPCIIARGGTSLQCVLRRDSPHLAGG